MNDPPNFEVEQIPGPALLVGGDGSVVRANIHAKRLFGYGDRDGAGLEFEQIIHPEHRHRCRQLLDSAFVDHTEPSPRQTSEFKGVTLDGRQITVEIIIGPATSSSCAIVMVHDVTERAH